MVNAWSELPEPPRSDLCQHRALVRNGFGHHHIESADTIRSDEQQPLLVDDVDVSHFAAAQWGERKAARLHQHQTRNSSTRSERAARPAKSGVITSRRNSST